MAKAACRWLPTRLPLLDARCLLPPSILVELWLPLLPLLPLPPLLLLPLPLLLLLLPLPPLLPLLRVALLELARAWRRNLCSMRC